MLDWRKMREKQITDFLMKQFDSLKGKRKLHERLWELDNKLFNPRRYDMNKTRKPGEQFGVSIYDSNPAQSARKFSIGYSGQIVERDTGDQWIHFEVPEQRLMKDDDVKEYLQNYAVQIAYGYRRSNFYREFPPLLREASVTSGVMTADTDLVKDRIVFRNRDSRDHWFGIDQYGEVDVDFFRLDMTAKSLYEKFDKKKLTDKIIKNMEDAEHREPFAEYEVYLAVLKNGSVRFGSKLNEDLPWISFYIIANDKPGDTWKLLGSEGHAYNPVINLRIGEITKSGIPISMASDALTSAIYGNALSKHQLHASHLSVQPPILASETLKDQILLNMLNPNSQTFATNAEEKIEYLTTKLDYKTAEHQVLKNDDVVNDIFYISFLELLTRRDTPVKTATEILKMESEKLGLMGPVVESTENEALEPGTDIISYHERNRLPDMPQVLVDYIYENGRMDARSGEKKIRANSIYMGRIHRLMRSLPQARSAIEQMEIMAKFAELAPTSLVLIKMRKTLERILVGRGMPQDEMHSEAELEKIDADIAAAQQREEQLLTAEKLSKIIPSVTKDAVDPESPAALLSGAVK